MATQNTPVLNSTDPQLMQRQSGVWNNLMDRYFRLEFDGFENLPEEPCLLIGVHSGGPLTMDAWTVIMAWWRQFEGSRHLHGTAHDVLMNAPVLGEYFRRLGVISPSRDNIRAAFDQGDDVIPGIGGHIADGPGRDVVAALALHIEVEPAVAVDPEKVEAVTADLAGDVSFDG